MSLGVHTSPAKMPAVTDQDILDKFSCILGDLLGDSCIVLKMESTRADVPGWDSFNYVNFIVAIETELAVRFNIAEIESFENVGAIVARVKAMVE